MVRRQVTELPSLPAEIAAAARSAAARKTVALALAPTASQDDFEVYCAKLLAEHADEQERIKQLADSTSAMAQRATQRCRATTELLRGCFERAGVSGVSSWEPSYSLLPIGFVK